MKTFVGGGKRKIPERENKYTSRERFRDNGGGCFLCIVAGGDPARSLSC